MFSLLRLIGFVDFGWMLFDDADEGGRLRSVRETKSKVGPKKPHPSLTPKPGRMGHPLRHLRN